MVAQACWVLMLLAFNGEVDGHRRGHSGSLFIYIRAFTNDTGRDQKRYRAAL